MPNGYEKMRDAFMKEGMSEKAAKTTAARIWNSIMKTKVTGAGAMRDKRIEDALSRGKEGGGSNRRMRKGPTYE